MIQPFKYAFIFFAFLSSSIDGIGLQFGPLDIEIAPSRIHEEVLLTDHQHVIYAQSPICYAIKNRKLIEMTLITKDEKGPFQLKKLTVEPYGFGFGQNNQIVLEGYQVKEVVLNEDFKGTKPLKDSRGRIRFTEEGSTDPRLWELDQISTLKVLENTVFQPRESYLNGRIGDRLIIRPICVIVTKGE